MADCEAALLAQPRVQQRFMRILQQVMQQCVCFAMPLSIDGAARKIVRAPPQMRRRGRSTHDERGSRSQSTRAGSAHRLPATAFEVLAQLAVATLRACARQNEYVTAHELLLLSGTYFFLHKGLSPRSAGETEFLSSRIKAHPLYTGLPLWECVLGERLASRRLLSPEADAVDDDVDSEQARAESSGGLAAGAHARARSKSESEVVVQQLTPLLYEMKATGVGGRDATQMVDQAAQTYNVREPHQRTLSALVRTIWQGDGENSVDSTSVETASRPELDTTVGSPDPSIAARQVAEGAEATPPRGLPVEDFADCFPGSVSDTLCAVNGVPVCSLAEAAQLIEQAERPAKLHFQSRARDEPYDVVLGEQQTLGVSLVEAPPEIAPETGHAPGDVCSQQSRALPVFVCSSEQEDDNRTSPSGLVPRSFNLSADVGHPNLDPPSTSPTDAAGVGAIAAPGPGAGTAATASAATQIQTGGPVLCLDCNGNRAVVGGLDTNVQLHDLGMRDGGGAAASLLLSGHAGAVTSVALCNAASCKFAVSGSLDTTLRLWMLPLDGSFPVVSSPSPRKLGRLIARLGGRSHALPPGAYFHSVSLLRVASVEQ